MDDARNRCEESVVGSGPVKSEDAIPASVGEKVETTDHRVRRTEDEEAKQAVSSNDTMERSPKSMATSPAPIRTPDWPKHQAETRIDIKG